MRNVLTNAESKTIFMKKKTHFITCSKSRDKYMSTDLTNSQYRRGDFHGRPVMKHYRALATTTATVKGTSKRNT